MVAFPQHVTIVEVGPRDGLQNESKTISTDIKIQFIDQLSQTGLPVIEAASFVAPKWVPQMADHSEVMKGIKRNPNVRYAALVPNVHGFKEAIASGANEVAVFTAASETFSRKNTNCSIEESFNRIADIMQVAKKENIPVRGYVSCTLGCPFEGAIKPEQVLDVAYKLLTLGCYQISLGDTIGVGTPNRVQTLIDVVTKKVPIDKIAIHFHDTYAQALVNIYVCLAKGISTIDSSTAGLGGCPYAPGASGNVATEDVVYMLNGLGIHTGVDLKKLTAAGQMICQALGIKPRSKASAALARTSDNQTAV